MGPMLRPLRRLQGAMVATVFEVIVPRGALLPAISFYVTVPRSGAFASLSLLRSLAATSRLRPLRRLQGTMVAPVFEVIVPRGALLPVTSF